MIPYTPRFENPYPQGAWEDISNFTYTKPLILYRDVTAPTLTGNREAEYIVYQEYEVRFELDGRPRSVVVPAGMLTDLSSVPKRLRSIVDAVGPHLEASIVHDFLYIAWQDLPDYSAQKKDQVFADKLLRAGMRAAGVTPSQVGIIYEAVKLFGWGAFKNRDEPRYVKLS